MNIKHFPVVTAYTLLFLILLLTALPHGMNTELSLKKNSADCTPYLQQILFSCRSDRALTPLSTLDDVIDVYQMNDHASYATAAKNGYQSVASVWAPGLIVVEELFYSLSPTFPVGLGLAPIACALWAGVMTTLWSIFHQKTSSFLLSFIPVFLLAMCIDMPTYLGSGLFLGETYAIAAFLLGIGILVNLLDRRGHSAFACLAGVAFAMAAYFRAQYDQIMVVATGLLIVCSGWFVVRYRNNLNRLILRKEAVNWLQVILFAACTYHMLTLPYRLTHYLGWIDTSNSIIWRWTWEKPEWFTDEKSFFIRGGGAAGCVLDPERCHAIWDKLPSNDPGTLAKDGALSPGVFSNRKLQKQTVRSFLHHPVAWISFKTPYILRGIADTGKATPLVSFFMIILGLTALKRTHQMLVLSFFLVIVGASIIGPLLLIHLEPRYLDPFTTLISFAAICAVSGNLGGAEKEKR